MDALNGYQQANCGIKNFVPQEGVEYMPSMGANKLIVAERTCAPGGS